MSVNPGIGRGEPRSETEELTWSGDDTRTIHVRLSPEEYYALRRRAHAAGLRPWDLARHWVVSQLDRQEAAADASASDQHFGDLAGALADQGDAIADLVRRIERLEQRELGPLPGSRAYGHAGPQFGGRILLGGLPRRSHPKLHEEILSILNDAGGPMTSEEIAEQVTVRRRYQPRSGHAISAAAISGRIANPRYRGMFRRDGRLIMPAVGAA